jgi:hypothetical protein
MAIYQVTKTGVTFRGKVWKAGETLEVSPESPMHSRSDKVVTQRILDGVHPYIILLDPVTEEKKEEEPVTKVKEKVETTEEVKTAPKKRRTAKTTESVDSVEPVVLTAEEDPAM